MDKNSFVFYRSFREAVAELSPEQRLEFYEAIIDYALDGTEPELSPLMNAMFKLAEPVLERNNTLYENGRKGGRPKNQTKPKVIEPKTKENQRLLSEKPKVINSKTKENQRLLTEKPNPSNDVDVDVDVDVEEDGDGEGFTAAAPTLGEISLFFVRIGSKADPQKFYDYYGPEALSNMDWHAKAEEWKKTQYARTDNSNERWIEEWLKESQENSSAE